MIVPQSAYVHVPFCRRRCFYCDFPVSIVGDKPPLGGGDRVSGSNSGTIVHYVEMLCQEIAQTPSQGSALTTVFLGGGTPSLLSAPQLHRILDRLDHQFGLTADAEISMEIDPASFDLEQIQGFKSAGITRVSVGAQAFQSELLTACGRSHTVADIDSALTLIRQVGFTNISLDLISGLPNQTLAQWEETLAAAIARSPTHLSCYDLIVETGTAFAKQYKPGETPLPSDETAADMYRTAQRLLTAAGYEHYEISNYAQPGYQCRHNRVYWKNQPFYGFGMGATSYVDGDRVARPRKTWEYYDWVLAGGGQRAEEQRNRAAEVQEITDPSQGLNSAAADVLLETLMLGLRLADGVDWESLVSQFGAATMERVERCLKPFVEKGWVVMERSPIQLNTGSIHLTDPEGFLFSNRVLAALFEEFDL